MNRRPLGPEPSALAGLSHAPNEVHYTPSHEILNGFSFFSYNHSYVKTFLRITLVSILLTLGACTIPRFSIVPVPRATDVISVTMNPSQFETDIAPDLTPESINAVNENLGYLGALSAEQQEALVAAAQAYVSLTADSAQETAISLDYIGRNANPATMCGPLSLAILRDAGIIQPDIPLIEFYYLNPRPGNGDRHLNKVFPPDRFEKIIHESSIAETDFSKNPLFPGDFLYLFAGHSGSFEHMLVVTRVDEAGRAFSVTNINNGDGVIIQEVMLYDPALPGIGQFYEWTSWENRNIGRTGYGGFWLWRPLP